MQHHLPITKTARYFTSQAPGAHIKQVWVVVHGYGQLAEFFLRKFHPLFADEVLVVAPEGLHRYYREGYSGRVGASWMTKEDRLSDIADYVGFLDDLHSHIAAQVGEAQWRVVGFSQGAATAARWLSQTQADIHQFIVWAGSFPNDVNLETGRERLNAMDMQVVIGTQDQFITEDHILKAESWFDAHNLTCTFHRFDGDHDIPPQVLSELRAKWVRP